MTLWFIVKATDYIDACITKAGQWRSCDLVNLEHTHIYT